MLKTKVTSLEEIRVQTEPEIVELPGFRAGTVINVKLRMIDLTPKLLELRVSNPLLAEAQKLAQEGVPKDQIAGKLDTSSLTEIAPLLDTVAQEALMEPTYQEIMAIHPLTLAQKLKIFSSVLGEDLLLPFRSE